MNSHHERSSYGNRVSTSSSIKYQQIKKMAIIFFSLEDKTLEQEDTITSFIDVYNNTKFPAYR